MDGLYTVRAQQQARGRERVRAGGSDAPPNDARAVVAPVAADAVHHDVVRLPVPEEEGSVLIDEAAILARVERGRVARCHLAPRLQVVRVRRDWDWIEWHCGQ